MAEASIQHMRQRKRTLASFMTRRIYLKGDPGKKIEAKETVLIEALKIDCRALAARCTLRPFVERRFAEGLCI